MAGRLAESGPVAFPAMEDELPIATTRWTRWLPVVLLAFVASRLVLLTVVVIVDVSGRLPSSTATYSSGPILRGFTGSDALYYLGIAAEGYHSGPVHLQYHDWVFFPAYPLVVRLLSPLALGDVSVAGVLVANALLLLGLCAVAALVAAYSNRDVTARTVFLVAFAPGAVAFGLAYSDSLLLVAAAGALLAARRGRFLLMGALYAVAALSRPPGLLLGIPLAIELWNARAGGTSRWLPLTLGPIAVAVFAGYQGLVLGDPLAFVHGQGAWDIAPITEAPSGAEAAANPTYLSDILPLVMILLGTLLFYTAMLPGLIRSSLPRAEVALALVAYATVFLSGRLQSDARYLAIAWPFAWFLASRRRPWRDLWPAVFVVMYTLMAVLNVTQALAP